MRFVSLSHCALRVRDMDKARAFYRDILGLEEVRSGAKGDGTPLMVYLRIADDQYLELFYPEQHEAAAPIQSGGFMHICLAVEDIDVAAAHLQEKGVPLFYGHTYKGDKVPKPFEKRLSSNGTYLFFVEDPDGNQIEIQSFPKAW